MMGQIFSSRVKSLPLFDVDVADFQVIRALEYVSRALQRKRLHLHMIVVGESLPCLLFKMRPTCRTISVLQVSDLRQKEVSILARAVKKAAKRFGLGGNWFMSSQLEKSLDESSKDDLIQRSLHQNDIVFSSEGMTLVAVDHCYSLKTCLDELSKMYRNASLDEALVLLRRLVLHSRGRPLSRGYIRRCFPWVDVQDQLLLRLNAEYEHVFGTRGVVGVNDEYIGWRREGLTWSSEMEEYRRDLASALSKRSDVTDDTFYERKPLPEVPNDDGCADLAAIFAEKALYN